MLARLVTAYEYWQVGIASAFGDNPFIHDERFGGAALKGRVLVGLVLLALSAGANAQVFKCVDGKGRVTFSQVPCAGQESKAVEIRNNQIGGQLATDKQVGDHQLRRNVEKDLREIDRKLADLKAKDQKGACKRFSDQELRTMIIRHQVVPGMKMSDVFRAWGRPESINGSQHVWWFGTMKPALFMRHS